MSKCNPQDVEKTNRLDSLDYLDVELLESVPTMMLLWPPQLYIISLKLLLHTNACCLHGSASVIAIDGSAFDCSLRLSFSSWVS